MVCSTCGFENQDGMRFCGMCGTPLPHRPLTTPGAQSTLNYTRVPVESGPPEQTPGPSVQTAARTVTPGNGSGTTASATYNPAEKSTDAPIVDEAPPTELVPDIPLDEYVQRFHYQPPDDATEVTMRGDAAPAVEPHEPAATATGGQTLAEEEESSGTEQGALDADEIAFRNKVEAALHSRPQATAPVESKPEDAITPEPARNTSEATIAPAPPRFTPEPKVVAPVPPASDSVASRSSLEPESPVEERGQRPRFLDIDEPVKERRPVATSGTSPIVGPSFLGLSDAPLIAAEGVSSEAGDEEPPRNHWRGWLAVAIVLVFAALGIAQWRSQALQTGHSPLQIIRAKIDNWRNGSTKPADQNGSTTPAPAVNTQPETQGAQQLPSPTPDATNSPAATPSSTGSTTATTNNTPAPVAPPTDTAVQPAGSGSAQSPPTVANSAPAAAAPVPKTSAASNPPASKSPSTTSNASATAENTPPKPVKRADTIASQAALPGAEEIAKAKDASDSAAAAAWLWKATAKGNPEAPVQLADMYIKGNGVPRSCEQAVVLLKTAAEKENSLARNRLASMYATGNCVQRNRVEAYRWLSAALAANPNSQWAQQNRDLIWGQMTPDEQAAAQKYR